MCIATPTLRRKDFRIKTPFHVVLTMMLSALLGVFCFANTGIAESLKEAESEVEYEEVLLRTRVDEKEKLAPDCQHLAAVVNKPARRAIPSTSLPCLSPAGILCWNGLGRSLTI